MLGCTYTCRACAPRTWRQYINLSLIPLADGWEWHRWLHRQAWGLSIRWIHHETLGIYRCLDCGYECTDSHSIASHNRDHQPVADEVRRAQENNPRAVRVVTHDSAEVAD
jgi:hypothetical protein